MHPTKVASQLAPPAILITVIGLIAALVVPAFASGRGAIPLAGDWTGDGTSAPGWYVDGTVILSGAAAQGGDLRFTFGRSGDYPVVGDWNGDGIETIGVVRNGRRWHLKNSHESGPSDVSFTFGSRFRRETPVVGDWNGDGKDTAGLVRGNRWLLTNAHADGRAQIDFTFGRRRGDTPVVGDWRGMRRDTPGVVRDGAWYLSYSFKGGNADLKFHYGREADKAIAGNWNGRGGDTPGVVRGNTWYLKNALADGPADAHASLGSPASGTRVDGPSSTPSPSKSRTADDSGKRSAPAEKLSKDTERELEPPRKPSSPSPAPRTEGTGDGTTALNEAARPAASTVKHGVDLARSHVGLSGVRVSDLRPSGPVVTSRDGQVIEGLDIEVSGRDRWAIDIRHDDVVVRNNRIRHPDGGQGVTTADGTSGVLIEHNVFDAVYLSDVRRGHTSSNNNDGQRTAQIRGDSHTIRRNHVLFARSAFWVRGDDHLISENYIEPLADKDGVSPTTGTPNSPNGAALHGTAISNAGPSRGWTAERNVVPQGGSGGIVIYSSAGTHQDLSIIDNYFYGTNNGFAVYGGRTHDAGNYNQNRNIRIEGNRFSGTFGFSNVRGRGTNTAVDLSRPGNTFTNNRFIGENTDLPARCGQDPEACG